MLAQKILQGSAQLSAAMIGGIALYKKKHMTFVIEGTLYWNGWRYEEMVNQYLTQLNLSDSIAIKKVHHHSILGAMRLVMYHV